MGVIVEGFTNTEKGILINTKPNDSQSVNTIYKNDNKIIGGIINTTEK